MPFNFNFGNDIEFEEQPQRSFRNLFGTNFNSPGTQNMEPGPTNPYDYTRAPMSRYDVPEYDYGPLQRYQDFLGTMPTRQSVKPGIWDRIGAIAAGGAEGYSRGAGAGVKLAQDILDRPYERKFGDWKMQGAQLQSEVEKANTSYDRALKGSQQRISIENQMRDDKRQERNVESQIERRISQTKNDEERLDLLKNEAQTKGARTITDDTGKAWLLYPDGRRLDTGLKTNAITQDDRKELNFQTSALTEGRAVRGDERKFGYDQKMEDTRQKNRKELLETREANKPDQVYSPTQLKQARNNAASRLQAEDPTLFKKFITITPQGKGIPNQDAIEADPAGYKNFRDKIEALAMQELNVSKGIRGVNRPQVKTPTVSRPGSDPGGLFK